MRVVKKPEERRAEMVSAASKLFAQQGFVRTSVAEIVSAVDVAKGLFYYYFTTKDDMVKAVVEGYCSYLGALAQQAADGVNRETDAALKTLTETLKSVESRLKAAQSFLESQSKQQRNAWSEAPSGE